MKDRALTVYTLSMLCVCSNAIADSFGTHTNEFEIEFVTIGDPGNPPDTSGIPNPVGSVDYVYNIGKHEISRDMIEKASAAGGLGLTLHPMDFVTGGARPDMPATGVSWNEAARFVNWLNESNGFPPAYKFGIQPGEAGYEPNADIELWEPIDPGFDPSNRFRNSQAHYVIPTADEWYKAAYYDPNMFGDSGGYWNYPTGSHTPPTPVASGTDPGTAVHSQRYKQGPADITQAGGLSPYGVMALGGNVWEWEETELDLVNDTPAAIRGVRGGRWLNAVGALQVYIRDDDDFPTHEFLNLGFRVGSLPERSSRIDFDVFPGVGRFPQSDDSAGHLIVEQIQNGYRIRATQTAPNDIALPQLTVNWDNEPGQWYRVLAEVKSVSSTDESLAPEDIVGELDSADEIRFGSHILAPRSLQGTRGFSWQFNPQSADLGQVSLSWDFMAIPIDPPTPGDANADGAVGFGDFLALTHHFNLDGWGWSGGDFNFDGTTDFTDYLILSDNFGRTAAAAAIPEPSSFTLFALGFFALSSVLRRNNR